MGKTKLLQALKTMSDKKKQKLFAGVVVAAAGIILFIQAKVLFLALLLSVGAYLFCTFIRSCLVSLGQCCLS
jgi:uncharacterized membrane protein HdeD (DUF308 family)